MPSYEPTTRELLNELVPGDRIEVVHEIKVGLKTWATTTVGAVEHVGRRRHGLQRRDQAEARRRHAQHGADRRVHRRQEALSSLIPLGEGQGCAGL